MITLLLKNIVKNKIQVTKNKHFSTKKALKFERIMIFPSCLLLLLVVEVDSHMHRKITSGWLNTNIFFRFQSESRLSRHNTVAPRSRLLSTLTLIRGNIHRNKYQKGRDIQYPDQWMQI